MLLNTVIAVCCVLLLAYFIKGRDRKQAQEQSPSPAPAKGRIVRIASDSNPSTTYEVSPDKQTCTCPDWRERRSEFGADDPRRFCKHLTQAYEQYVLDYPRMLQPFEDMILHFAFEKKGIPLGEDSEVITVETRGDTTPFMGFLAVRKEKGSEWIDLYEGSERYGYNVKEERWSYGNEPQFADAIIENMAILK